MKKILLMSVMALGLITSCSDDTEITPKEVVKDFKINENEVTIINSQTLEIKIDKGNAPYKVDSVSKKGYLTSEIKGDKLFVTAVKGGEIMNPEKMILTVSDSKNKIQKIVVHVYESLDVRSLQESINVGHNKSILFSSGHYDIIKVTSDDTKIATASKEVAQIGGQSIKVINVSAVSAGTAKITVTDGIVTKVINIKCVKENPIRVEAVNPPSLEKKVIDTYNFVVGKDDEKDDEKVIYLYGANGEFETHVTPKGAITTVIEETGVEGEHYLRLKLNKPTTVDNIKIKISQKDNSDNNTTLNVKLIEHVTLSYFDSNSKPLKVTKDGAKDDVVEVKKGDVITVKIKGGFANDYKIDEYYPKDVYKIDLIDATTFKVTLLNVNDIGFIKVMDKSYITNNAIVTFNSPYPMLSVSEPSFLNNESKYQSLSSEETGFHGDKYTIKGVITIKKGDTMTFNLMDGNTNDYFYSIDRLTGSVLSEEEVKEVLEIPNKVTITEEKKAVIIAKNTGELILRLADWNSDPKKKSNYYYKVIVID